MDRAIWDNYHKGTSIDKTLKHHNLCHKENTLKLKKLEKNGNGIFKNTF